MASAFGTISKVPFVALLFFLPDIIILLKPSLFAIELES